MELEEGVEGRGASLLGSDHQEVGQAVTALLLRPRMDNSKGGSACYTSSTIRLETSESIHLQYGQYQRCGTVTIFYSSGSDF
jgi:hypothetical protein